MVEERCISYSSKSRAAWAAAPPHSGGGCSPWDKAQGWPRGSANPVKVLGWVEPDSPQRRSLQGPVQYPRQPGQSDPLPGVALLSLERPGSSLRGAGHPVSNMMDMGQDGLSLFPSRWAWTGGPQELQASDRGSNGN